MILFFFNFIWHIILLKVQCNNRPAPIMTKTGHKVSVTSCLKAVRVWLSSHPVRKKDGISIMTLHSASETISDPLTSSSISLERKVSSLMLSTLTQSFYFSLHLLLMQRAFFFRFWFMIESSGTSNKWTLRWECVEKVPKVEKEVGKSVFKRTQVKDAY